MMIAQQQEESNMGSLGGNVKLELPTVYMSDLNLADTGSKAWETARKKVASALANYGGFEVAYDLQEPILRDELIEQITPDVFKKQTDYTTVLNEPDDGLWTKRYEADDGLWTKRYEQDDGLWTKRYEPDDGLWTKRYEPDDGLWTKRYEPDDGLWTKRYEPDDGLWTKRYEPDDGLWTKRYELDDGLWTKRYERDDGLWTKRYEPDDGLWTKRYEQDDGLWTKKYEQDNGLWMKKSLNVSLKSFRIMEPTSLIAVQDNTKAVWPKGNDFCNTIWKYSKEMHGLIQLIHRMILESLGLDDHYEKHMESLAYALRLSKYSKDLSDESINHGIPAHMDPNYISIVCQHKVEGLEVEAPDGEWIRVSTMPNSYTVLLGEVFNAWSNGRVQAANHRVKISGTADRYSVTFNSFPCSKNDTIEAPKELVEERHPLLFKPFKYRDYMRFCHSEESAKYKHVLKAFCGVSAD